MSPDRLRTLLVRCGVQRIIDRGTNFQALCPYHKESEPSWGISKTDPHLFGCFSCHARGSIVKLLVDKLDVTYTKAAQIAETKLSAVPARDLILDQTATDQLERIYEIEDVLSLLVPSPIAYRYLLRRGVSLRTSRMADVRFDYNDNRVVFPWVVDRQAVGATGRSLKRNERAKTVPYASMEKGRYLYFPRKPKPGLPLTLVEGEIDALKTSQSLGPQINVAALGFGVFTKHQQSLTLKIRPREVVTMFDYDDTGRRLTELVNKTIGDKVRVRNSDWNSLLNLFGGPYEDVKYDPAEVTRDMIRYLYINATGSLTL